MDKTYPICGCPEPGCRCRGFVGDEPRALCSSKIPCPYQLRAHMPMKTRAEELKELLSENQEKISELSSSLQEFEISELWKLWDLIDTRVELEIELSKIGG